MENFQEFVISSLKQHKFIVKDKVFEFDDGVRIRFSDISNSHTILAEKVGIAIEYMQESNLWSKGERTRFWQDIHKSFMDKKLGKSEEHEYKLLIDSTKGKDKCRILYNTETGTVGTLNWHAFAAYFSPATVEEIKKERTLCEFIFNPNLPKIQEDETTGDWIFNKYIEPSWRKLADVTPQIPKEFDEVLNHLFLNPESKEYALKWLHSILVGRSVMCLVLNGSRGAGKGVFEVMARALVGWQNSDEPSSGFLSKEFNSIMMNKKLLILDEIKVTLQNQDKIKRYTNKFISFEGKGIDAGDSTENFCSFIISNNKRSDLYVEHDERKLSIIDITSVPLNKVKPDTETHAMVLRFEEENSTEVAEFGKYLLKTYGDTSELVLPFKGNRYWELVQSSLSDWKKVILDMYSEGATTVSIKDLRRAAKKHGVDRWMGNTTKIADFLMDYRHGPNKLKIGYTRVGEDGLEIVFNKSEDLKELV